MTSQISKKDYTKLILQKLEENDIWINKMVYISPSNDQKIQLADMILDKLRCKAMQIPAEGITSEIEPIRVLAELTPTLYLRVNWS